MVEMLGVLAIIGVLSIGGIVALRHALEMHKVSETIHELEWQIMSSIANGGIHLKKYEEEFVPGQYYGISKYKEINGSFVDVWLIDNNGDCNVPMNVARKVTEYLLKNPYVWRVSSDWEYYYHSMDEFEEEAEWREGGEENTYCIIARVHENFLERPSADFREIDYKNWENPTSCAGHLAGPCSSCTENGGWPVTFENKSYGALCEAEGGLSSGVCTKNLECVDLCEEVNCPVGTECNNGICICENGSTPCGNHGCCPEGTVCGRASSSDASYACLTPTGSGCITNSDCNDSSKYCKLKGSNAYTPQKGTCEDKGNPAPVNYNGRQFISSNAGMSYWAAENFCKAHNKKVTNLTSLGLTLTETNNSLCAPFKAANMGKRWYWVGNSRDSGHHYNVCICSNGSNRIEIGKSGGYGGIQDGWFPLCED